MTEAQSIIDRLRRDLTLAAIVRGILAAAAGVCLVLEVFGLPPVIGGTALLVGVGAVWLFLSFRSARGSRLVAIAPQLIAAGELAQAERSIKTALRSFSLFRSVKLRSLYQLAILRHAQARFAESAVLCRELLQHRLGSLAGMTRSARLVLADSLMEQSDAHGAHMALASLYTERLTLGEAVELTAVQLDYLCGISRWDVALERLRHKLELAELMNPARSARTHALLALAAFNLDKSELAEWLKRRVEAIADPAELISRRPVLSPLWPGAAPAGLLA